ncbi:hypothetical protein AVEN_144584-1 [Araneus ventricosus]|uniref:Uncharacterized protein n=1 Tax=Araneus ventricosus TaxID=182803 RepID=A0A4Y2C071_ARAVE|nr:hypothetical protein AVEN_144584-1 [Araneus ventricosus]
MNVYSQIFRKTRSTGNRNNRSGTDYQRNRQQFTSNKSNSIFRFSNTNSQQFASNDSNSTFNSAQLTDCQARTADETLKSFQSINSLLLCDPSEVLLYSPRQAVTSYGIIRKNLNLGLNRDIEKAFSGIFDLSPSRQNGS